VTIDFEEVIPYSGEMNTSIVVDAPVDAGPQPPQPSINAVFEAPYYLTVLRAGQTNADLELSNNPDTGYVAAIAAKPQNNSLNALLYTDGGIGEFEQVSRLDYCDILQLDQPIIETASSFTVIGSLDQTASSNNLILLNGELMGFMDFDDQTKVLTVKRGVLDTVPKKHSSGSLFVFDLPDVAFDSTQYAQSENVEVQVLTTTPSGIQELSESGQAIEIESRAIRPYPPANVKINGEYWPDEIETDLIITWVDRNRVQQTGGNVLGWYEGGVTVEPGTATHLMLTQFDEDQVELATNSANVTGTNTFSLSIASMQPETRAVEIVLKTVRDGFECYQPYKHTLEIQLPFSAPYDLLAEYVGASININWKMDGFVHELRYYCSTSHIDVNDSPEPKLILSGESRSISDIEINADQTYYIRIGSYRNGVEKFSDEVQITTSSRISYRHYRIYVTAVGSGTQVYLGEVELRTAIDGADVTSPSTPTNQSSYTLTGSNPNASKLVDNNTGTWWLTSTGSLPAWASFDLLTPMDIKQIAMLPNASYPARAPRDFIIQGSNDGVNWTNIQVFTGKTWAANIWNIYDL
jgi:hypothetical protein